MDFTYVMLMLRFVPTTICRIDGISWDTKGLDAEVSKGTDSSTEEYNKLLVSSYIRKFFMIIGLMTIIGVPCC
jgi:hypothetical protein